MPEHFRRRWSTLPLYDTQYKQISVHINARTLFFVLFTSTMIKWGSFLFVYSNFIFNDYDIYFNWNIFVEAVK